jgi:hypothetical protein
MSDLVLDVSAAEFVFRRNAKGAGIVDLLDAVRASGGRLWIYTGEAAEILRLSSMSSSQISELTGYHSIGEFLENFQWLSALAADMVDLDESDPMAEALIRAAARLGDIEYFG